MPCNPHSDLPSQSPIPIPVSPERNLRQSASICGLLIYVPTPQHIKPILFEKTSNNIAFSKFPNLSGVQNQKSSLVLLPPGTPISRLAFWISTYSSAFIRVHPWFYPQSKIQNSQVLFEKTSNNKSLFPRSSSNPSLLTPPRLQSPRHEAPTTPLEPLTMPCNPHSDPPSQSPIPIPVPPERNLRQSASICGLLFYVPTPQHIKPILFEKTSNNIAFSKFPNLSGVQNQKSSLIPFPRERQSPDWRFGYPLTHPRSSASIRGSIPNPKSKIRRSCSKKHRTTSHFQNFRISARYKIKNHPLYSFPRERQFPDWRSGYPLTHPRSSASIRGSIPNPKSKIRRSCSKKHRTTSHFQNFRISAGYKIKNHPLYSFPRERQFPDWRFALSTHRGGEVRAGEALASLQRMKNRSIPMNEHDSLKTFGNYFYIHL